MQQARSQFTVKMNSFLPVILMAFSHYLSNLTLKDEDFYLKAE